MAARAVAVVKVMMQLTGGVFDDVFMSDATPASLLSASPESNAITRRGFQSVVTGYRQNSNVSKNEGGV